MLHLRLDDLARERVPSTARAVLVELLAALPIPPTAEDDTYLVGPEEIALDCLAVLARHVVEGLRDHNIGLMQDRSQLKEHRLKLLFFSQADLVKEFADLKLWLETESVLIVRAMSEPVPQDVQTLIAGRRERRLATFGSGAAPPASTGLWRKTVRLDGGG